MDFLRGGGRNLVSGRSGLGKGPHQLEANEKQPQETASTGKGSSILGDVLTYGLTSILVRGLTFFLIPLYTRFLTPADYGVLSLVNQIGMVVSTVLMLNGIGLATMTFFLQAKSETERRQVVTAISSMIGVGVVVAAALTLPIAPFINTWFDLKYSNWVFILGCVTVLGEVAPIVPYTLMQARIESRRYMMWHAGSLTVRLLATILVVAVFKWGIVGILIVRAATGFIVGGVLLFQEIQANAIRPPRALVRRILGYTLPFVPVGLFSLIRGSSQRFFLLAVAGLSDLGIFSLGATLCGVIDLITIVPFNKVWNAKMYAVHEAADAAVRLGRVATKFGVLYLLGAVPMVLFGRELLAIVSADSYAGALQVFIPLLIAGHIETYTNVADQVFIVHHKTHYKPYIVGAVAGVTVLLYWFLIPRYGLLGAAWGQVASSAVRSVIIFIVSGRVFPIRWDVLALLKLWVVSAAVVAVGAQLPHLWWMISVKVVLLAAWAALLLVLGVVPREDALSLVHFLKKIPDGLRARRAPSAS